MKKSVRIKIPLPLGITDAMDFKKQLVLFLEPATNKKDGGD